ncbi:MAG: hypothetical protein IT289_07780 [Oligoflexia bacterium]|nr:hypothetical protein [Oligoflexia bacterium]
MASDIFMSKDTEKSLTKELEKEVNKKLLAGVNYRSGILFFAMSLVYPVFGLYLTPSIQKFDPTVELAQNVGYRIIFNTIPCLIMGGILIWSKLGTNLKTALNILMYPLIIHLAAWVYVWPLILQGQVELFYFVHAPNIFAITIWFIYSTPPFRVSIIMLAATVLFFQGPVIYVLYKGGAAPEILRLAINDSISAAVINIFCAVTGSNLRRRLAVEDVLSKNSTRKFLGAMVAEAIFERREDLLTEKRKKGFIVAMDLRGYSQLMITMQKEVFEAFMMEYSKLIYGASGRSGGYLHKSAGDGHILSFGIMNDDRDLSDIEELKWQANVAEDREKEEQVRKILDCLNEIEVEFEKLILKYSLKSKLKLGIGVSYGEVILKMMGNAEFRLEYDIEGKAIVEAVRIETYTKELFKRSDHDSVIVLFSPTSSTREILRQGAVLTIESGAIKDFPDLTKLIRLNHSVTTKVAA